jgi:hypothetical protein
LAKNLVGKQFSKDFATEDATDFEILKKEIKDSVSGYC